MSESRAFLGVPRHAAAGALADYDDDDELSVDEARELAKAWVR